MPLSTQQLRLAIRLGIGIAGVSLLLFLSVRLHGFPKELIDVPLFVAPMLTVFVASFALGDFALDLFQDPKLKKEPRDRAMLLVAASAIAWALALGVCFMLVSFTSWYEHLIWIGTLFAIFIGWDFFVLKYLGKNNKSYRDRIAWGNRIVNRPTISALLLALVFLGIFTKLESHAAEVTHAPSGTIEGAIAKSEPPIEGQTADRLKDQTQGKARSPQELFVTGLIFFHLVAAACGYLATFFSEIRDSGKVGKAGYYLFYWTPEGSN